MISKRALATTTKGGYEKGGFFKPNSGRGGKCGRPNMSASSATVHVRKAAFANATWIRRESTTCLVATLVVVAAPTPTSAFAIATITVCSYCCMPRLLL